MSSLNTCEAAGSCSRVSTLTWQKSFGCSEVTMDEKRKINPEFREHMRRTKELSRYANEQMQAAIDRSDARRRAEAERRERRRRLVRRLFLLDRAV